MADEPNTSQSDEQQAAEQPKAARPENDLSISQEELDGLAAQLQEEQAADTAPTPAEEQPETPPASADTSAEPESSESNLIDQAELDALATQLQQEQADGAQETPSTSEDAGPPAAEAAQTEDELAAEMAAAIAAESGSAGASAPGNTVESPAPQQKSGPTVIGSKVAVAPENAVPLEIPQLATDHDQELLTNIDLLDDVELEVKIELGRTQMYIEDVLRLGAGSMVELDKLAGDPVDIFVNDRKVACGEVLVLNDNFCVRISSIVNTSVEPEEDKT